MANGEDTAIEGGAATEPKDGAEESENPQADGVSGNFLLPDVLPVLSLAGLIDILDVVFSIGTLVSLILGAPLLLWMVWKTNQIQSAREQTQRVRRGPKERERNFASASNNSSRQEGRRLDAPGEEASFTFWAA